MWKKNHYSQLKLYIRKNKQTNKLARQKKTSNCSKLKKLKFFKRPIFLTDIFASELCNTLYTVQTKVNKLLPQHQIMTSLKTGTGKSQRELRV